MGDLLRGFKPEDIGQLLEYGPGCDNPQPHAGHKMKHPTGGFDVLCIGREHVAPVVELRPEEAATPEQSGARPAKARPVAVWKWNQALRDDPVVIKTLLAVALVVGTYADPDTGLSVWPAAETIGRNVGIARKNVYAYLQELESLGYLTRTGLNTKATSYRLTLPRA